MNAFVDRIQVYAVANMCPIGGDGLWRGLIGSHRMCNSPVCKVITNTWNHHHAGNVKLNSCYDDKNIRFPLQMEAYCYKWTENTIKNILSHMYVLWLGFDKIFNDNINGCIVSQHLLSSQFSPVWPSVHTHWPLTQMPPFWHWRLLWHTSFTTSQRSPARLHCRQLLELKG